MFDPLREKKLKKFEQASESSGREEGRKKPKTKFVRNKIIMKFKVERREQEKKKSKSPTDPDSTPLT